MTKKKDVRTQILIAGGFVLFAILVGRLADLQLVQHSHFMEIADAQRKRASDLQPHRGTIYVHDGKGGDIFPIASNKQGWIVYAVPRNMKDPRTAADTIAPALVQFRDRQDVAKATIIQQTGQNDYDVLHPSPTPEPIDSPSPSAVPENQDQKISDTASDLYKKFDQKTDPYEPLLKPYEVLDDDFLHFLQDKKLPGIVLEQEEVRTYPEGSLLAHEVGYVGFDGSARTGRYGIEGYFESILKGDLGFLSGERGATGGIIGVAKNEFRPAEDGSDIVLTVDRVVQAFAEQELKAGVEKYRADRGSILVMNPKTGAVIAMATYPTFDPNAYYAVKDAKVQTNPIVSDSFEPGSILKPVIMSGALNDGLVTPDTTFVDSGPVRVGKYTINTFDGKHFGAV
jgi:cell division protein FtsI/penicillin-binding protein 2